MEQMNEEEKKALSLQNKRLAEYISSNWGKVINAMLYDLKSHGLKGKVILHNATNIDLTVDIKEEKLAEEEQLENKEQENTQEEGK